MDEGSETGVEILLVEDNPGDVRLVEEALRETRGRLHITRDGKEALEFLHRRNGFADAPRPEIVLLDLNLPKVDGTEILDELRSTPELDSIRVIILTSARAKDTDIDPETLAEVDFLTKPTDPDEFISLVRSSVYD